MTYISWRIDTLKSGEMAPCHQSSRGRWRFQLSQESGFATRETWLSKMKLLLKLFSFTSCRTNFVEISATALLRKWLEFLIFALGCRVCVRCVCVRACVRTYVRVCVCVCARAHVSLQYTVSHYIRMHRNHWEQSPPPLPPPPPPHPTPPPSPPLLSLRSSECFPAGMKRVLG